MAVRFYEVIALDYESNEGEYVCTGNYLGKTSDLVVKREEDKTVDLDNGDTEVGSEKISITFSILGEFKDPLPVKELWLLSVPPIDNPDLFDVTKIKLKNCDYHWEAKTGEFGKINFSATLRHSSDNEPISIIEGYGRSDNFIYIAELSGNIGGKWLYIKWAYYDEDIIAMIQMGKSIIKGKIAIVDLLSGESYKITVDDDKINDALDATEAHGLIKRKYVIS